MITLGIIADTHIPDRSKTLPPEIIPIFQQAGVDDILHAGDISVPRVLTQLEQIAPVHAVRGNRDMWRLRHLPISQILQFEQIKVGITHGHGSLGSYLRDKLRFLQRGPMPYRIVKERAVSLLHQDVDVVIFGHNHSTYNQVEDGKLVFNPGSACCPSPRNSKPSIGIIKIEGKNVYGEIIEIG
ncbi:MAG: YfcE family phosphodiesterase [Chloroflexota bacterium]